MKKLFYLLVIPFVLGFFSCSDDDNPRISFTSSTYILPSEEVVEITVTCTQPVVSDLTVGFSAAGSAVKGEDYTLSAEVFVIESGKSSAKITISPKNNFEADKSIVLTLNPVAGYDLGSNMSTTVGVEPKEKLIYSFNSNKYDMPDTLEISMKIKPMEDDFITLEEMHIPFKVSSKSTAEEGVHFEVVGGVKEFIIPKGEKEATVKLAFKEKVEGKDNIVLAFGDLSGRYIAGNFIETSITINGHLAESNLVGKWAMESFSNYEYFKTGWGFDDDKLASLPIVQDTDTLEFAIGDNDEYLIKPNFQGDLKNYFRDCEFSFARELGDRLIEASGFPKITLSMMDMTEANVNFSASNETLRSAQIGFRIIEGGKILEVTINDYEPTDFLVDEYSYMKGDDPTLKNMPLRFHFKRVE